MAINHPYLTFRRTLVFEVVSSGEEGTEIGWDEGAALSLFVAPSSIGACDFRDGTFIILRSFDFVTGRRQRIRCELSVASVDSAQVFHGSSVQSLSRCDAVFGFR